MRGKARVPNGLEGATQERSGRRSLFGRVLFLQVLRSPAWCIRGADSRLIHSGSANGMPFALYLGGRRYFATANAPVLLPMAVPTSVEVR